MKQTAAIPADGSWVDRDIREFSGSPVKRISDEWMLITAGSDTGNWNTMTASWGGLGELWAKHVAFMYIRPTRRTFGFANESPLFTLSFFNKSYHKALEIAGTKSGRDIDKAAETGLTPIVFGGAIDGAVGFKEAEDIIICKKLYEHDFDSAKFLDPAIEKIYPEKDYHRMYIGEVLTVKTKK
ncbi:MAG: flavin reductase [Treponema sp.]|jgi:flavin reductase (DIM6/NTAB) family NADH-FMN oxidoreductase RutF|nr:flavin reductase [Treponema sp.]